MEETVKTTTKTKSRAERLGAHVPESLDPTGAPSAVVTVRLTLAELVELDAVRGPRSRSAYVRELIRDDLGTGQDW
jgi:hypothetical protein